MKTFKPAAKLRLLAFICAALLNQGCYHFVVATKAQPSTNSIPEKAVAHSLFWGLVQKPVIIPTPVCNSMEVYGVAEVKFTTNLGYALITVLTLGIYCPVQVEWYCSKPCPQEGIIKLD